MQSGTLVTVSMVPGSSPPVGRPPYPYLEREDILAALEYAAAVVNERDVPVARPASSFSSTQTCRRKLVDRLHDAGYEVRHVPGHGRGHRVDEPILAGAAQDGWVVVTADTDFSTPS